MLNNTRMHQPLVLLHSSASSGRQWEGLMRQLPEGMPAHRVDLHGHGARPSWHGDHPLGLLDEARLALDLFEGADGVHLIGHSYGGAVALKLASLRPDKIRSLTVFEPVMFGWLSQARGGDRELASVNALANAIERRLAMHDSHGAAAQFIDFWNGAGSWKQMPAARANEIARHMPDVGRHFTALLAETMTPADLSGIAGPVHFLTGNNTVAAMRCLARHFQHCFPTARHTILMNMGHLAPMTHALELGSLLLSALHGGPDAGPGERAAGRPHSSMGHAPSGAVQVTQESTIA